MHHSWFLKQQNLKQGKIHSYPRRVQVGRESDKVIRAFGQELWAQNAHKRQQRKKGTDQPTNQWTNPPKEGKIKQGGESCSTQLKSFFLNKTQKQACMLTKRCILVALSLNCISLWYLVEKVMSCVHSMYSTITKI